MCIPSFAIVDVRGYPRIYSNNTPAELSHSLIKVNKVKSDCFVLTLTNNTVYKLSQSKIPRLLYHRVNRAPYTVYINVNEWTGYS